MIFGAGSKVLPALILTNLWTLVLLFLAWNHGAGHEVAQSVSNVGGWLGFPPDRSGSEMADDPLSSLHRHSDGVGAVTATPPTQPVGAARDPSLPAYCPECGEGDLLCAKYGSVSPYA